MHRYLTLSVALVLSIAVLSCASMACAAESEQAAVTEANSRFYAALNALFSGETAPMSAVWSHADDAVYMGPGGGVQVGWKQILENWQAQAARKLGGKVTPAEAHVLLGPNLAVVSCYETGENIVDGKPTPVRIRATNIFRKENGKWLMVGHHTDLLPYLAQ